MFQFFCYVDGWENVSDVQDFLQTSGKNRACVPDTLEGSLVDKNTIDQSVKAPCSNKHLTISRFPFLHDM